jgi:hypothetical protein
MALGLTQSLTEISTRNLPGAKGQPACKAENPTAICVPIVYETWELRRLATLWASTACYRDITFYLYKWSVLYQLPQSLGCNFFSMAFPAHSGPRPVNPFRNHFSQTVGLLGRVINPSQGRYLNTGQHKHKINAYTHQTSMP